MNIFRPSVSNEWQLKWSPAFLLASLALLAVSLIFGPHSFVFLAYSVIIGLITTVLTLTYWKWAAHAWSLILLFIDIIILIWGMDFTTERMFIQTRSGDVSWQPVAQYLSVIFTILYGTLFLFRSRLKRFLVLED